MNKQSQSSSASTSTNPWNVSDRYLPALKQADLPEPIPLRKMIGPSIILLGASIGSGEFILWPNLTARFGFVFIWAAVVGIITQYFLNLEIERWALATGETAVTGFCRLSKWWAPAFIVMTVVPWAWPGWATGATTCITFITGQTETTWWGLDVHAVYAIIVLFIVGLVLTVSPVVYTTVEKIQFALVCMVLAFLVITVFLVTRWQSWTELFSVGLANFGATPGRVDTGIDTLTTATFLGALAFAGAGGTMNLAQANWIRDKGYGMGARIPRIVSPFTKQELAIAGTTGYTFPLTAENCRRWNAWWRNARREHFWVFLVTGGGSIIILSVLAHSTVFGRDDLGTNMSFILHQGETLKRQVAPWFGISFYICGAIVLFSTELGIIDMVGRVVADIVKVNYLPRTSESTIYFIVVWTELILGAVILLFKLTQPLVLLIIGAALNGIVMFIYSALLLYMNKRVLRGLLSMRPLNLIMMIWCTLFFGFFSIQLIREKAAVLLAFFKG